MSKYIIEGSNKLAGEITVRGAKNSVLPILAASILNNNMNIIFNIPDISDLKVMVKILKAIGCKVSVVENIVTIDSRNLDTVRIPEELVR